MSGGASGAGGHCGPGGEGGSGGPPGWVQGCPIRSDLIEPDPCLQNSWYGFCEADDSGCDQCMTADVPVSLCQHESSHEEEGSM